MTLPFGLSLSPLVILFVVLGAALLLTLLLKPRLLLLPLVAFFAWWAWLKVLIAFPRHLTDYLLACTAEKHASGLASHATAAQALWSANTEFRPAAREIYRRVQAGYGIHLDVDDDDDGPGPSGEDAFNASKRSGAIAGINASRGGVKSGAAPAGGAKA